MRNNFRIKIPIFILVMLAWMIGAVYRTLPAYAASDVVEVVSWSELQEKISQSKSKDTVYRLKNDIKASAENSALIISAGVMINIDLNADQTHE